MKNIIAKIYFLSVLFMILTPIMTSWMALLLGIILAIFLENPFLEKTKLWTHKLLSWSVMGLGAGMNLITVGKVGISGIGYTVLGISFTLLLGFFLSKLLNSEEESSILISVGTAICGGSAIAAVAPTIRAKSQSISIALGTVFILNACALIIFPAIGHHFQLTEHQFGLWSALAIHDTSSVVGATMSYGVEALQIGTTVKLARALWIVPITLIIGFMYSRFKFKNASDEKSSIKKPWFILGFIIMASIFTWVPNSEKIGHMIEVAAKKGLVMTLFFIGANLSLTTIKAVGVKPMILGLSLWIIVASTTFCAIYFNLIH